MIEKRHQRLARFAKRYGCNDPLQRFMSIEATLENAQDDLELIKLGFIGGTK